MRNAHMADSERAKQFPELSHKLTAPKKGSLFERQRQEAEAKRLREEAETAAVYDDFVKSFENEDGSGTAENASRGQAHIASNQSSARGVGPRHFGASSKKSGPGSLGFLPPLERKRVADETLFSNRNPKTIFGPDESAEDHEVADERSKPIAKAIERSIPRPTIQMSSLPPGTSPAVLKSLLPSDLVIDNISISRSTNDKRSRRSDSATVTLAKDTPYGNIDAAVSTLQGKYLGRGFNLSLSRQISSTMMPANKASLTQAASSLTPFGAKPQRINKASSHRYDSSSASHGMRFAPPTSYNNSPSQVECVVVNPPDSLVKLRLINKTVEAIVHHGPEFEALLMSNPSVLQDKKWSFLWNARTDDGVWYRWRLWKCISDSSTDMAHADKSARAKLIFDETAPWVEPDVRELPFEYVTEFDALTAESDYDSSEEEDSGDELGLPRRSISRSHPSGSGSGHGPPGTLGLEDKDELTYLNPLRRSKLLHLLARLPLTTAKLRRGDVARITAFAISHASDGADEITELLVANITCPFRLMGVAQRQSEPAGITETNEADGIRGSETKSWRDDSSLTLVGLHVISDILAASSTSGLRHSWKYRQLIHAFLLKFDVFKFLGHVEHDLLHNAGRIKADKWRRSILQSVLGMWESRSVFMEAELAKMTQDYEDGVLENGTKLEKHGNSFTLAEEEQKHGRWRSVQAGEVASTAEQHRPIMPGSDSTQATLDDRQNVHEHDKQGLHKMSGSASKVDAVEDSDSPGTSDSVYRQRSIETPAFLRAADAGSKQQPQHLASIALHNTSNESSRKRPRAVDLMFNSDEDDT